MSGLMLDHCRISILSNSLELEDVKFVVSDHYTGRHPASALYASCGCPFQAGLNTI
jgi:hypothetical protein